jgi:signal transduction histidine kinase
MNSTPIPQTPENPRPGNQVLSESERPLRSGLDSIFPGNSEMARLMRAFDWSTSEVGIPEKWPESLKAAVRICVGSRNPIVIWWGRKALTQIYNDGYMRILTGAKHPHWLGRSGAECWSEIMETMGPLWDQVLATGEATWFEDFLYIMNRNLPREECYFTFSYSALRNDAGIVDGILCICYETTSRVIADGRLRTLRDLGRTVATARTAEEACKSTAKILEENPADIPFALFYLLEKDQHHARLVATTGFAGESEANPQLIDLRSSLASWPLRQVLDTGSAELVTDLSNRFRQLPGGSWPESPETALIIPIVSAGQPRGFLVAGLSQRRILDADYRSFFDLIGGHISMAVGNATAYEQERKRAEELAKIDRAKTAFFSNVSHEFRTPLTLMLGPLQDLLARGEADLSLATKQQLELVNRNGTRLLRLVNTLLDFSRIEAGRTRAVYQPIDLSALTAELASTFRSATERAGLNLMVDCCQLGEPVYVDTDVWEKIVLNLLSNAFKFTFEGEITVNMKRVGSDAQLRVSDTGVGIPAEEMPKLFERFHRIPNTRSRTFEGSGIGLALVQELVKLHGGSIYAESVLGKGTTFTVRIPLGQSHLPAAQIGGSQTPSSTAVGAAPFVEEALRWLPDAESRTERSFPADNDLLPPATPRVPEKNEPRARVLIADDNSDMRQYLVRLLERDYEVETVANGREGLESARKRVPDLVLSDVMMPILNGFELLKALRAQEQTRTVPVILLSARAGEESRVEGMQAGADDYLVKPFSARELLARVSARLEIARLQRNSEQRQAMLASELQHRVHNIIAIIRTIAARTARSATSVDEYAQLMSGRLLAMARTQALLAEMVNEGIDIATLVREELSAQVQEGNDYDVEGPTVAISPKAAEVLSLAIHELATNALKYGAFSEPNGKVFIRWLVGHRNGEPWLSFCWSEVGAHPIPHRASSRRGFGTELIERRIPYELQGVGRLIFDKGSAQCEIEFPLRDGTSVLETQLPCHVAVSGSATEINRGMDLAGFSVLIVEDDFYLAADLERELRGRGASIDGPFSSEDLALEYLKTHKPDAALLDINFGHGPSFQVAQILRARHVPLIFVTGYQQTRMPADFAETVRLQKPVDVKTISRAVERLLGRQAAA